MKYVIYNAIYPKGYSMGISLLLLLGAMAPNIGKISPRKPSTPWGRKMQTTTKVIAAHQTAPRRIHGRILCVVSIPAQKCFAAQYWTPEQITARESTYCGDKAIFVEVIA